MPPEGHCFTIQVHLPSRLKTSVKGCRTINRQSSSVLTSCTRCIFKYLRLLRWEVWWFVFSDIIWWFLFSQKIIHLWAIEPAISGALSSMSWCRWGVTCIGLLCRGLFFLISWFLNYLSTVLKSPKKTIKSLVL